MKNHILILFLLVTGTSYSQLSFIDSATSLGLGVTYGDSYLGGGVSFCDFDGDGWDDITYSTHGGEEVYFYKNNSGISFSLVDLGIHTTGEMKQVIWVDYDNDSDKDFMVTSVSSQNKFYRNNGDMTFTDVTSSIGILTDDFFTNGVSFGDIDNDGDLDMFVSNRDDVNYTQVNILYRNDNGIFTDITATSGISSEPSLSFCSAFFDYDNDGDQDIYVAVDKLDKNRLYQNDGSGKFTDVSDSSGAGIAIDAMSTTIGDYNNDGWFDIYVTNSPEGNQLLENNGNGTFTNVASEVGTGFFSVGWGSVFLDADNDSDLDLYVSGMLDGSSLLPSAFYQNQGDNTFLIPTGIGFANDTKESYSNAIGDFNNDGLPDIIVMNDTDNNFLWENTTSNSNNWLKLKLQGVTSNKDGIGSRIEVSTGGKTQYRYTLCGEGYLGQNSNTEFVGIGTATSIDQVKITWLSGTIDIFENVAPNQTLTIIEGQTLSVKEFNEVEVNIYPNPVRNKIHIRLNNNFNLETKRIELFSLLGNRVLSKTFTDASVEIDTNELSSGVYLLKCLIGSKLITKKVFIK